MAPVANTSNTSAVPVVPHGALHPVAPARLNGIKGRPDMLAVGTVIWLASELMFFAALFAAYFNLRNVTTSMAAPGEETMWQWGSAHFMQSWFGIDAPWFSLINTTILVLSSITCQVGVHRAERGFVSRTGGLLNVAKWGMREWYTLTFVMGAVFLGGQAYEYATLVSEGFLPSTNAYTSAFFLATGFHGLHVLGGLILFIFMLGRTYIARTFTHEQRVSAIVASYYWHFVDIVWIILFAVIYIIR
ncbi:aa3-type cytochrome oxidase subunit III [Propioniciclava sp.]|jgi:cytochrome c oxidase subunit 3|uniref:aa3-type cytochrome oxidase subunit III n=1 Tax=Propioniciclava sp. TaxID=2038686 RepID=UPI003FA6F8BC